MKADCEEGEIILSRLEIKAEKGFVTLLETALAVTISTSVILADGVTIPIGPGSLTLIDMVKLADLIIIGEPVTGTHFLLVKPPYAGIGGS